MARTGITFQLVQQAAEQIILSGTTPTIEKVRFALGGTGSNSTIAKYLNEWKSNTHQSPQTISLPPDSVNIAVNQVWDKIKEESEKKIHIIREETFTEITEINNQLLAKEEQNQLFKKELNELKEKYRFQCNEKEIINIENKKIKHDLMILKSRYQALDEKFKLFKESSNDFLQKISLSHESEKNRADNQISQLEKSYHQLLAELKSQFQDEKDFLVHEINELKQENIRLKKSNNEFSHQMIEFSLNNEMSEKNYRELENQKNLIELVIKKLNHIEMSHKPINFDLKLKRLIQIFLESQAKKEKRKANKKRPTLKSVNN